METFFHDEKKAQLASQGLNPIFRKLKILVVDDDEDFSDVITAQLRKDLGCQTTQATNPYEAMNLLLEHYYDLVILDWKLQTMSGASALKKTDQVLGLESEISPQWDSAKVPVIVISADTESESHEFISHHFKKIGFIHKLQSLEEICGQISNLIKKQNKKRSFLFEFKNHIISA